LYRGKRKGDRSAHPKGTELNSKEKKMGSVRACSVGQALRDRRKSGLVGPINSRVFWRVVTGKGQNPPQEGI